MAKDLKNATRIDNTDPDFPDGKMVDGAGGTLIDTHINQDVVQFFHKLMRLASISPNGNFDNENNGYQFISALLSYITNTPYEDPTVWVNQTLINGWTGTIKARVDKRSYVEIIGTVDGSAATNTSMCTLTSNERPNYAMGFSMHQTVGNDMYSGQYETSANTLKGYISPFPTSGIWFFYVRIPKINP